MAKGVEDTSFYRYVRLLALNEVGSDPSIFGVPVDRFHAETAASSLGVSIRGSLAGRRRGHPHEIPVGQRLRRVVDDAVALAQAGAGSAWPGCSPAQPSSSR